MTETIREHLEAIYDEIGKPRSRWSVIQQHAVDALDLLGNAHTWYQGSTRMRAVPDPAPITQLTHQEIQAIKHHGERGTRDP